MRYSWPGNVRELANIIERLSILHPGGTVTAEQVRRLLPDGNHTPASSPFVSDRETDAPERSLSDALEQYERQLIAHALASSQGNVAEAARRLQTDRPNLYRRMRRLGLAGASDE
jgi:two-component system, NtrC family, nitrogen regulation response regulator NtrX